MAGIREIADDERIILESVHVFVLGILYATASKKLVGNILDSPSQHAIIPDAARKDAAAHFKSGVPKWRNWQTRYVQGVVRAISCGFESHLRHQIVTP